MPQLLINSFEDDSCFSKFVFNAHFHTLTFGEQDKQFVYTLVPVNA